MLKKQILCTVLLAGSFLSAAANKLQETVYLKNGSIIKCSILEMVPDGNLKIQTYDGSIFVYPMTEVERIAKENASTQNQGFNARNHYVSPVENTYEVRRGYRGFADMEYTFGVGDYAYDRFEVSTSHGFQFNPYLFLGGGMAISTLIDYDDCWVPMYVHLRGDLPKGRITPFVDLKSGYSFGSINGAYFSTSIGARFALTRNVAINAAIGYQLQGADYYVYYNNGYYYNQEEYDINMNGISLRIGIEF